jgi:phage gp29-like protein
MAVQLLDAYGRPVRRDILKTEVAAATMGGVRSPMAGYPADGLTPVSLADILREADAGNPLRYLELAETIEERDPHYMGVLGTRRRSVAQIGITVDAASEDPEDEAIAQEIRVWLARDELTDEIFDILDCIGKGFSMTEILWDTSEGQWMPRALEWRDPRWFRFQRADLKTPVMIGDDGQEVPLEPFKFIFAQIKAKSGLTLRSGLARVAAWGWMFKMYTQRDWAIFSQTYGQPVRVGKYGSGASEQDKATLFRAVANIAGDCAAIIPESMTIDFIESGNVGAAHTLYKERCEWLDQQISKAVLGQTSTTDAVIGGLGSGKEHRQVQKDIQMADGRALAGILNRDLVRPWVQLNHGPRKAYPRIRIEEVEREDLKVLSDAITPLIDRGLEVEQATILTRFGLPEARPNSKLLSPVAQPVQASPAPTPASEIKRVSGEIKRGQAVPGMATAPQAEGPLAALPAAPAPEDVLTDRMAVEAAPAMDAILAKVAQMMAAATSLDELRQMLLDGFPQVNGADLTEVLAMGMLAANLGGRVAVAEDAQPAA